MQTCDIAIKLLKYCWIRLFFPSSFLIFIVIWLIFSWKYKNIKIKWGRACLGHCRPFKPRQWAKSSKKSYQKSKNKIAFKVIQKSLFFNVLFERIVWKVSKYCFLHKPDKIVCPKHVSKLHCINNYNVPFSESTW